MEEDTWLNDTDLRPEKRIGVFDHTHRGVMAFTYDLPFGHGRQFDMHSRWMNTAFGGWLVNGIYTVQTGQPVTWMGTSSTTIGDVPYFGAPLDYNPRQVNGPAFNLSAFTPPVCQADTGSALASCITANQFVVSRPDFLDDFVQRARRYHQPGECVDIEALRYPREDVSATAVRSLQSAESSVVRVPERGADELGVRTDYRAIESAEKCAGGGEVCVLVSVVVESMSEFRYTHSAFLH